MDSTIYVFRIYYTDFNHKHSDIIAVLTVMVKLLENY